MEIRADEITRILREQLGGFTADIDVTEVGTVLSVTESHVSQLHASAVLRLRVMLRRQRIGAGELTLERGQTANTQGLRS